MTVSVSVERLAFQILCEGKSAYGPSPPIPHCIPNSRILPQNLLLRPCSRRMLAM